MAFQIPSSLLFITFLISLLIILRRLRASNKRAKLTPLPPGPKRLPLIGNIHQVIRALPHHSLASLARKYGPLMHLQLGELTLVVISSPDVAKEILKDREPCFAQRPELTASEIMSYANASLVFAPYGDYWRNMRKLVMVELLNAKRVTSFQPIRDRETWNTTKSISSSSSGGKPINLTKLIQSLIASVTSTAAFGERCEHIEDFVSFVLEVTSLVGVFRFPDLFPSIRILRHLTGQRKALVRLRHQIEHIMEGIISNHEVKLRNNATNYSEDMVDILLKKQQTSELNFPITMNVIKDVIMEMFSAGVETSSTTLEWAMSELVKNPLVMMKAQAEVRTALKGKNRIKESDIQNLDCLKNIVKETLRLHPPVPLILREATEECTIRGYRIPRKAMVLFNLTVLGRDPAYWSDPESFKPERFEDSSIDFRGGCFVYLPFGGGRRICPGINFAMANIELPLAQLLYHFDWETADGKRPEEVDMTERYGITARRKNDLVLIPTTIIATADEEGDAPGEFN
ncbi:hypothetical protein MLD38_019210 [Melastoma candidum]|uniref:Uncharacterized protein n=1 Tax=Melastoma candidum TaxID=119954 RepID=A0ACB9QW75_9MYRT|nr:hypothetical protein MLD38_019210 [Melastoma candidum]